MYTITAATIYFKQINSSKHWCFRRVVCCRDDPFPFVLILTWNPDSIDQSCKDFCVIHMLHVLLACAGCVLPANNLNRQASEKRFWHSVCTSRICCGTPLMCYAQLMDDSYRSPSQAVNTGCSLLASYQSCFWSLPGYNWSCSCFLYIHDPTLCTSTWP